MKFSWIYTVAQILPHPIAKNKTHSILPPFLIIRHISFFEKSNKMIFDQVYAKEKGSQHILEGKRNLTAYTPSVPYYKA